MISKRLEIAYRLVSLCLGDLRFTPSKKCDESVWAPMQNRWLEISSCSNCADFQAWANIKFHSVARGGVFIRPALQPSMGST